MTRNEAGPQASRQLIRPWVETQGAESAAYDCLVVIITCSNLPGSLLQEWERSIL